MTELEIRQRMQAAAPDGHLLRDLALDDDRAWGIVADSLPGAAERIVAVFMMTFEEAIQGNRAMLERAIRVLQPHDHS